MVDNGPPTTFKILITFLFGSTNAYFLFSLMDIERKHKGIFIVRGFEVPEKREKCLVNSRVI